VRIGVHPANAKEFNWIFNTRHCAFIPDSESKMVLYEGFLREVGSSEGLDRSGGFQRQQFLPLVPDSVTRFPGGVIGVVMGSTWPTKDLPKQGYDQLVRGLLVASSYSIVLLGDKTQATLGGEIEQSCGGGSRVLNLAGRTSLAELMGVLASCSAVIGPDSGPGHLSSLLGTPYVTVFGPTDPVRVAPLGSEHLAVVPQVACAPCWRRRCPGLDTLCMRLHSPREMVARVVEAANGRSKEF
jgi:ADP-heptose:LPS heptosyltransferase